MNSSKNLYDLLLSAPIRKACDDFYSAQIKPPLDELFHPGDKGHEEAVEAENRALFALKALRAETDGDLYVKLRAYQSWCSPELMGEDFLKEIFTELECFLINRLREHYMTPGAEAPILKALRNGDDCRKTHALSVE
ncbi:hypothetical protein [Limibacillus sp. MBR-115]|jgi:hypothetical protein|uniref:hypothetical protein n=1 Tax=Limibacillus sp. MBR-115 TaxID=3156465 RepID=UPI00339A9F5A